MSPDDRWRVRHMIEAAEQALAFVAGRDRSDLDGDAMLRLSINNNILWDTVQLALPPLLAQLKAMPGMEQD